MTQLWQKDKLVAVTKVLATPCTVVQVKQADKDGYEAVQLGCGQRKAKNIKKAQKGHFKGLDDFAYLKEFRAEAGGLKRGDKLDVSSFVVGDSIQVAGVSKGKGFQGVVRRHGFSGSKKTHGNKDQLRMPGSVGATGPAHVFKGTRMGGRMGNDNTVVKNLEVAMVAPDEHVIYIKGAVPGAREGYVLVSGPGEMKAVADEKELSPEAVAKPEDANQEEDAAGKTEAGAGEGGQRSNEQGQADGGR